MLASVADPERQRELVKRIVSEHLSVRQTEKAVRDFSEKRAGPNDESSNSKQATPDANIRDLETKLGEHLQTRVRVDVASSGKKGKLIIEFFDLEQFDGLMSRLGFESS